MIECENISGRPLMLVRTMAMHDINYNNFVSKLNSIKNKKKNVNFWGGQ